MKTIQKRCTKCGDKKDVTTDNFYKDKRTLDGFCSECKRCALTRCAVYRNENRVLVNQREVARKHLPSRHYSKAKREAKERNLLWDIPRDTFDILLAKPCHYCGDKLEDKKKYTVGSGLDRIDNLIGYTIANVLPCCKVCNLIRNTVLTVRETEVLVDKLLELRKLKDKPDLLLENVS